MNTKEGRDEKMIERAATVVSWCSKFEGQQHERQQPSLSARRKQDDENNPLPAEEERGQR
jgi:hypothetical protein